jgi:hypothetical protein
MAKDNRIKVRMPDGRKLYFDTLKEYNHFIKLDENRDKRKAKKEEAKKTYDNSAFAKKEKN